MSPKTLSRLLVPSCVLLIAAFAFPGATKDKNRDEVKSEATKTITNSIGMKFVLVKKGKFTMGSPDTEMDRSLFSNEEEHKVEITRDFYLGVHEVTQKQYKAIIGTNPSYFSSNGHGMDRVKELDTDDFPVESVSWEDAQEFLRRLNAQAVEKSNGRVYRLPTEAEWEYACRGGSYSSTKPFHFDWPCDVLRSTQANFDEDRPEYHDEDQYQIMKKRLYLERTCKVGSYQPNKLGLYDMHGNVCEWCQDWFEEGYYSNSSDRDPLNRNVGSARVVRGGGWDSSARHCRSAHRNQNDPELRISNVGFRVVLIPTAK